MQKFFLKNKYLLLLWVGILAYILYFSIFTILRYQNLWASYFDLGIMHQTVYNTYEGIKTFDTSRILEMTDPHHSGEQVKRMAIHNDIILALLAPFYFIVQSPATLLVIQTVTVALGAYALYKIVLLVFADKKYKNLMALLFSFSYLLYPAMQRATIFDFHAVVLATTFLLFMYYFWLVQKYRWSFFFLVLSLITKEQVGMTTMMFGVFVYITTYYDRWKETRPKKFHWKQFFLSFKPVNDTETRFALSVSAVSLIWFILSFTVIIPSFRGGEHFATKYYGDHGDSPMKVLFSLLSNPIALIGILFKQDSLNYFKNIFGPLGFLSFFSPLHLFIAAPEFAVNLISNSWAMKQIIYHYTAVLQPFVFISAVYGARNVIHIIRTIKKSPQISTGVMVFLVISTLFFSFTKSPLPYSKEADLWPLRPRVREYDDVMVWKEKLKDPSIRVSTTGHIAPHFASRRYFYDLAEPYWKADYVVIQKSEVYNNFQSHITIPAYENLIKDGRFSKIYDIDGLEVYKKNNF